MKRGSAMYMKFTGTLVLSWFFWTWAIRASPTRSDPLSWPGSGRGSTPWNQSRSHTPCAHTFLNGERAWTGSLLPGCHMSRNTWGRTTNTMTSSGILYPRRMRSGSWQSPTDYSKASFCDNTTKRRQACFYKAAFRHCPLSYLRCLSYTDLCSRTKGLPYCKRPNSESLQPLPLPRTSKQGSRESYETKTTTTPPGDSTSSWMELSLPGPDSGGRSRSTSPAKDLFHAPADVRVRGTVGQQPLEASRLHPQQFVINANLFDHVFQDGDPEGISMNAPISHQDRFNKPRRQSFTRLPSKGIQGRPLPPMVLAGTAIIILISLILPQVGHVPTRQWQVVRLFRGVYARRLRPRQPVPKPIPKSKPHRSLHGQSPPLGWRLGFCLLLALIHIGQAVPQNHEPTPISTHVAQGYTNLCAKKHSFRRAQRQALNQGSALYRGRLMTDRQLGVTWTAPPRRKQVISAMSSPAKSHQSCPNGICRVP